MSDERISLKEWWEYLMYRAFRRNRRDYSFPPPAPEKGDSALIGLTYDIRVLPPPRQLLMDGELGVVVEWSVHRSDDVNDVLEHRIKRSESFVQTWLIALALMFGGAKIPMAPYLIPDYLTGYSRQVYASSHIFEVLGASGDATMGIVVGTDTTAPTITDWHLNTPIANGTGSGQLQYSAQTYGQPAYDSSISQFTVTRNFANASGGSITVNEIGMYTHFPLVDNGTWINSMLIRDVIIGGIAVPNGYTLTINYRPQASL